MQPLPLRSSSSIISNFHLFQVKVHCIANRFQRLASPPATSLAVNRIPFCHKVHAAWVSSSVHPSHCWARLGGQMDSVKGCPGVDAGGHFDTFPHNCQDVGGTWGLTSYKESTCTTSADDPRSFSRQCLGQSIEILRSTQIQPCLRGVK